MQHVSYRHGTRHVSDMTSAEFREHLARITAPDTGLARGITLTAAVAFIALGYLGVGLALHWHLGRLLAPLLALLH